MSNEMSNFLKEFVKSTVEKLVDKKDEVEVIVSCTTKNVIIQIKADKSDLGKIIGKSGRIIESLKIITSAIRNANFNNDPRKISIEILEDENSSFNYNK